MTDLSREQSEAASHRSGPAIVMAPPGAGKTTTLVGHHADLVASGVQPSAIIVTTFTAKAAEEMKSRMSSHLSFLPPRDLSQLYIGTFHSVCGRMLKRFHASAGLPRDFKILDVAAQRKVFAEIGIVWDAEDGDLTDIIGLWKDRMLSPAKAAEEAEKQQSRFMSDAAAHYAAYEREIRRIGACDFADLIKMTVVGLRNDNRFSAWIKSKFDHILVDEYQDVNPLQLAWLKAALNERQNIWAVADDDQSLYGWRGADVRYSVDFGRYFPGAKIYKLSTNYRSVPIIIEAASAVIACNKTRVKKELRAAKRPSQGDAVSIRGFESDRDEAEWIASQAKALISRGHKPGDMAILFRTASASPALQQSFDKLGVPFTLSGAQSFWDLPEVKAVINALKLVRNPGDRAAREALGIGPRARAIESLLQSMRGSTLHEAAVPAGRAIGAHPPGGTSAERGGLWADAAEQAGNEALRFKGYDDFFAYADSMAGREEPSDGNGVALTTIHSSKGLEWSVVIVAGCEASMMPHHKAEDVEEERRLFYVALTRAKRTAVFTYARTRFARGQTPSPFLSEMADKTEGRTGSIIWKDRPGTAQAQKRPGGSHSAAAESAPRTGAGGVKVYRRRGGKSLISPDERD